MCPAKYIVVFGGGGMCDGDRLTKNIGKDGCVLHGNYRLRQSPILYKLRADVLSTYLNHARMIFLR
jgi:hypothetical protein